MAGHGKHPHDSGRARYHRFLDRAQLEFDDMLIGDFLTDDDDPRDDELARLPVRYGAGRLSDPSDSAIAGALLDAGVFADEAEEELLPIKAHIGENLFKLLDDAAPAQVAVAAAEATPAPPVIRPMRVMVTAGDPAAGLTLRGFAQGFLIGAACAGAAVCIYTLVF